jgi:peptide/nickel transport system permease protein
MTARNPTSREFWQAAGWCGLGVLLVTAFLSDFLARYAAGATMTGPALGAPSPDHFLGTDFLGRDVLSETLHGLYSTVIGALVAMATALCAGGLAGAAVARLPRFVGAVLRWAMGLLSAAPSLLLAILLVGLAGRAYAPLAAGFAVAPLAFVRAFDRAAAQARSAHAEFARATGISAAALLRRDIAYELRAGFAALSARALAAGVIVLSTVSFLGFGIVPPPRDLGLMIAAARENLFTAWWAAAFPVLALMLLILSARLAAGLEEGERP